MRLKHRSYQVESSKSKLVKGVAQFDEQLVLPVSVFGQGGKLEPIKLTAILYLHPDDRPRKTAGFVRIQLEARPRGARTIELRVEECADEMAMLQAEYECRPARTEGHSESGGSSVSYELVEVDAF